MTLFVHHFCHRFPRNATQFGRHKQIVEAEQIAANIAKLPELLR
jgi:hypothetical protein